MSTQVETSVNYRPPAYPAPYQTGDITTKFQIPMFHQLLDAKEQPTRVAMQPTGIREHEQFSIDFPA